MKSTHQDLSQAIHRALRGWHSGDAEEPLWSNLLLVRQHLAEQAVPNLQVAVKKVLLDGMNALEQQGSSDAAALLRLRFLDDLTATATANRLNLTENIVFKQQRAAVQAMAHVIEQAERSARDAKATRVLERLEIQEPPRLFGTEDKLAELSSALTSPGTPWLACIVGIGGIGKTSLADAAARVLSADPVFADIAWVSARQDYFTLWDGLQETLEETPALTIESLVDALAQQFGFSDLAQLPPAEKQAGLRARLKALPYLVVIDNLETAADYRTLVPTLHSLVSPTRFLLTSRHSLHHYPSIQNLSLDELSADDSLALLRYEAGARGLTELANAAQDTLLPVFDVAGGNPLALKLLIGQMHTLPLQKVVDDLRQARGKTIEDLYRFIYWRSWNLLDDAARQVLAIMPLVAESGGGLEQIARLSTLDDPVLTAALGQLVTLCLVNVRGTVQTRRYSIHRLTETFLLNEVLKWQTTD